MNPYSVDPNQSYSTPPSDLIQSAGEDKFIREGRVVPAGSSIGWIQSGFSIFKASPGLWIGVFLINVVISLVLGFIPFLGSIASYIMMPLFSAGFMVLSHSIYQGRPPSVDMMFAGFKERTGPLALVGVLWFVGVIAIVFALVSFFFTSIGISAIMGLAKSNNIASVFAGISFGKVAVALVIGVALMLVLSAATYFAPALIIFHQLNAIDAMKTSFGACLKNFAAFLVYFLLFLLGGAVFGFLAAFLGFFIIIVLFVAVFVLWPTMVASIYAAYRQIFLSSEVTDS